MNNGCATQKILCGTPISDSDSKSMLNKYANVHVLLLGTLGELNGVPNLTLQSKPDNALAGYSMSEEQRAFLETLDPTTGDRSFSVDEEETLKLLDKLQAAVFIPHKASYEELKFIPTPRKAMKLLSEGEDSILLEIEGSIPLAATTMDGYFIMHVDGVKTMAEIVGLVKADIMQVPDATSIIQMNEEEQNKSFDEILTTSALAFIKTFSSAKVITLEPTK